MVAQSESAQRIERLTPLGDVMARIDALVTPVAPRMQALATAQHGVLADDVVAAAARPAASIALRDGYAVSAEATNDASAYTPAMLAAKPARCDVGDRLPAGADAIAPLDAIAIHDAYAEALALVMPGEGVLVAGADVAAGGVLRRAGQRLRAGDLAVLAAAGVLQVTVRRPRMRLVHARGDDATIAACVDFCSRTIAALGGDVEISGGKAGDLEAAFADTDADAIMAIGGTGSGRNDQSVRALARMGRVEMHGIGLTPGETVAFGMVETRPVLLVPGRIDAALAVFVMVGAHLLAHLTGCTEPQSETAMTLARKVTSTIGMAEMVPVRRDGDTIAPLAGGYLPLQALAQSDGWILVPPDSEGYPAGTAVGVRPWP